MGVKDRIVRIRKLQKRSEDLKSEVGQSYQAYILAETEENMADLLLFLEAVFDGKDELLKRRATFLNDEAKQQNLVTE